MASPAVEAKPSLTLQRRLKATPAQVFTAWTQPDQLVQWFGPEHTDKTTVRAELDVRVGGRFRARFNTKDGEYHEVGGAYREVVKNQKLVFDWAWHSTPERQSLVTVTLRADGSGTLLTLTHEKFFDDAARDGHKRGWIETLDKLERLFA